MSEVGKRGDKNGKQSTNPTPIITTTTKTTDKKSNFESSLCQDSHYKLFNLQRKTMMTYLALKICVLKQKSQSISLTDMLVNLHLLYGDRIIKNNYLLQRILAEGGAANQKASLRLQLFLEEDLFLLFKLGDKSPFVKMIKSNWQANPKISGESFQNQSSLKCKEIVVTNSQ